MPERFDTYEFLFGKEDTAWQNDNKDQRIAYAIVGYPGAGKSTAGAAFEELFGGIVIETGDIVRESAAKDFGIPVEELTSDELGDYATARRERDGGDWVAQETLQALFDHDEFPECPAIIVGMRDSEAPMLFRKHMDIFRVVWVHTTFEQRLRRLQSRGRQDEASFEREDLQKRDGRESMWGVSDLTFMADYKVVNHGELDDLRDQLRKIDTFNKEFKK